MFVFHWILGGANPIQNPWRTPHSGRIGPALEPIVLSNIPASHSLHRSLKTCASGALPTPKPTTLSPARMTENGKKPVQLLIGEAQLLAQLPRMKDGEPQKNLLLYIGWAEFLRHIFRRASFWLQSLLQRRHHVVEWHVVRVLGQYNHWKADDKMIEGRSLSATPMKWRAC